MVVNAPAEYREQDADEASDELLLYQSESNDTPCLTHFVYKWQCYFVLILAMAIIWIGGMGSSLKIIRIFLVLYVEMDNNIHTAMRLLFHEFPSLSIFVTTPTVGGTGQYLTAVNYTLITPMFLILSEQLQPFRWVVWLWQNSVPQSWLMNTQSYGYESPANNLPQLSGVVQMRVPHGQMSLPSMMTLIIFWILENCKDRTMRLMEQRAIVMLDNKNKQWWWGL